MEWEKWGDCMLEVIGLSKSYGLKVALKEVSLKLEPGLYGLLGPNGAGKSTLLKLITDNLLPDSGKVLWNGRNIYGANRKYRKCLGYAPQQQGLYDTFTGEQFLAYMGTLKEIPQKEIKGEIEKTAEYVNLTEQLPLRIKGYSGGMKQRLLVAQALMGNPRIVILDEPTAGLDPKERVRLRGVLKKLSEDKIILVATHVVSDVEAAAKQIIILKQGTVMAVDTAEKLIETYAPGESLEDVYMHMFE